jgi:hypothetical protein
MVVYTPKRDILFRNSSKHVNNPPLSPNTYTHKNNMGRLSKRSRHIRKMIEQRRTNQGDDPANDEQQTPDVGDERQPAPVDEPLPERQDSLPIESEDSDNSYPPPVNKGKGRAIEPDEDDEEEQWFPTLERERLERLSQQQTDIRGKGLLYAFIRA